MIRFLLLLIIFLNSTLPVISFVLFWNKLQLQPANNSIQVFTYVTSTCLLIWLFVPIDCPAFALRLFRRILIALLFRLIPNPALFAKFPLELARLKFAPLKFLFNLRGCPPLVKFKRLRLLDLLRCLLFAFKFVFELALWRLDLDWERPRFPFATDKLDTEFDRLRRRRGPVLLLLFKLALKLRAPRETPNREWTLDTDADRRRLPPFVCTWSAAIVNRFLIPPALRFNLLANCRTAVLRRWILPPLMDFCEHKKDGVVVIGHMHRRGCMVSN